MTREIQSTDWKEFCARFERLHRGDSMTVVHQENGQPNRKVDGLPLKSVRFDPTGDCSDRIRLTFGQEGSREILHEIIEPIHVKIQEESGRKSLRIDAENGVTLIQFSSGKLDKLLEGLKTA